MDTSKAGDGARAPARAAISNVRFMTRVLRVSAGGERSPRGRALVPAGPPYEA